MSKSRDQIDNTPPLSSGENTGEKARPSSLSASMESTRTFTQTTKQPSLSTSGSAPDGSTTPDNTLTTPPITEKARQHAVIAKAALRQLETAGLIRRFKVLSAVGQHPQKIRIEFDLSLWTEDLELR